MLRDASRGDAPEPFPAHAPKLLRAKGASTASSKAQQPKLTASLILPAQYLWPLTD